MDEIEEIVFFNIDVYEVCFVVFWLLVFLIVVKKFFGDVCNCYVVV